jgi:hypothetical protein
LNCVTKKLALAETSVTIARIRGDKNSEDCVQVVPRAAGKGDCDLDLRWTRQQRQPELPYKRTLPKMRSDLVTHVVEKDGWAIFSSTTATAPTHVNTAKMQTNKDVGNVSMEDPR